jgi:hypothetical protein
MHGSIPWSPSVIGSTIEPISGLDPRLTITARRLRSLVPWNILSGSFRRKHRFELCYLFVQPEAPRDQ